VTISGLFGLFGSLVTGPSLAGSVVQAEAETIGIHPSFITHGIQYSLVQTPLVTSVSSSPNSLATEFIIIQSWYYLTIIHLRDLHQLQHCELKQPKTNTPINNTTSQYTWFQYCNKKTLIYICHSIVTWQQAKKRTILLLSPLVFIHILSFLAR
jgi:hypothetical protein